MNKAFNDEKKKKKQHGMLSMKKYSE